MSKPDKSIFNISFLDHQVTLRPFAMTTIIYKQVTKFSFLTSQVFLITIPVYAADIIGQWQTIDDKTHSPKSIVSIYKSSDGYAGKIIKLINPRKPNPICDHCKGDNKNKPIVGLEILWGLKADKHKREWDGGKIMDPRNGKTYKCKITINKDGDKLKVRGYIGFSIFGRTQTWNRMHQ